MAFCFHVRHPGLMCVRDDPPPFPRWPVLRAVGSCHSVRVRRRWWGIPQFGRYRSGLISNGAPGNRGIVGTVAGRGNSLSWRRRCAFPGAWNTRARAFARRLRDLPAMRDDGPADRGLHRLAGTPAAVGCHGPNGRAAASGDGTASSSLHQGSPARASCPDLNVHPPPRPSPGTWLRSCFRESSPCLASFCRPHSRPPLCSHNPCSRHRPMLTRRLGHASSSTRSPSMIPASPMRPRCRLSPGNPTATAGHSRTAMWSMSNTTSASPKISAWV